MTKLRIRTAATTVMMTTAIAWSIPTLAQVSPPATAPAATGHPAPAMNGHAGGAKASPGQAGAITLPSAGPTAGPSAGPAANGASAAASAATPAGSHSRLRPKAPSLPATPLKP